MTRKWHDLSPRSRKLILIGTTFEAVLKVAALVDLAHRPAEEVRGSKSRWAAAIILVNSVGAVPIAYFRHGRRTQRTAPVAVAGRQTTADLTGGQPPFP